MSIPKNGGKFVLTVRILPLQEWYKVSTVIAVGTERPVPTIVVGTTLVWPSTQVIRHPSAQPL
jgi:hypothetical protein